MVKLLLTPILYGGLYVVEIVKRFYSDAMVCIKFYRCSSLPLSLSPQTLEVSPSVKWPGRGKFKTKKIQTILYGKTFTNSLQRGSATRFYSGILNLVALPRCRLPLVLQ